jgi:hypothetical protein
MKLSEIPKHIGDKVTLNGAGDLAFSSEFRPYLYPRPEIKPMFTIIKTTRKGQVYIQCDANNRFLAVNARNIDLIEDSGCIGMLSMPGIITRTTDTPEQTQAAIKDACDRSVLHIIGPIEGPIETGSIRAMTFKEVCDTYPEAYKKAKDDSNLKRISEKIKDLSRKLFPGVSMMHTEDITYCKDCKKPPHECCLSNEPKPDDKHI